MATAQLVTAGKLQGFKVGISPTVMNQSPIRFQELQLFRSMHILASSGSMAITPTSWVH